MVFCPNCKQEDCNLIKDRNGNLWELEDDINNWGTQKMEENNIITYTSYICNTCGNFFAIGKSRTGEIGDSK